MSPDVEADMSEIFVATFKRSQYSNQWYGVNLVHQDMLQLQNITGVNVVVITGTITISGTTISTDGKTAFFRVVAAPPGKAQLSVQASAPDGQIFDQPVDVITAVRSP
jgi:hypothetical protein